MALEIRTILANDRTLLDAVLSQDVDRIHTNEHVPPDAVRVALLDGEPVAFAFAMLLPAERPWAMLRGFVKPEARRRGVGRALLDHLTDYLHAQRHLPGLTEVAIGAWEPHDAVRALLEPLGYTHQRTYWRMRRPYAPVPAWGWPDGVQVRTIAAGAPVADWNDAFNVSFADHYRFVPSTVADCEQLLQQGDVRPEDVLLAYESDRPVGFARTARHGTLREIETLGVIPAARGRGLGRALLHWGIAELQRDATDEVTLMVEGENANARRLYEASGFAIVRTRGLWARPLDFA